MTSSGAELIEAVAGSGRAALALLRRRLPELVLGVAVLITALIGAALVASVLDDHAIAGHRAVGAAEVLDGSTFGRTLIRFTLPDGQAVVPERGVLYPRGLTVGTSIAVEYDTTDPELVRVAGRSVVDGLPTAAAELAGLWLVLGGLALWLHRRRTPGRAPVPAVRD